MRSVLSAALVGVSASDAVKMAGERDLNNYSYEDYVAEFAKNYDTAEHEARRATFMANMNIIKEHNSNQDKTWFMTVNEFAKNYDTAEHEARRATFMANMNIIKEHNSNQDKTWFMTVNEFADWTNAEFRANRMGARPELDQREYVGEFEATGVEGLPDSVDWRTKTGVMTPVKDQGGCGSCWAFSTVETLESHLAIATGSAAPILSPQQVVSCAPNPDQCGGTGGCQGSIQTLGFNYTKTAGITTEALYPYQGVTGQCQQSKIQPVATNDGYVKLKVNDYASLVSAVATKGPIAISLAAGSMGWQLYGGGVLTSCDCDQDHAVQLVGYGTENQDYWLVRNSWGPSWGEKGYIRIKRFGEGKEPTCTDNTPQDGEACKGDTKPRSYAGLCGIMGSSSYPTGVKAVGPAPGPPAPPSPPSPPSPPTPPSPGPHEGDCLAQDTQADCLATTKSGTVCQWCELSGLGIGICEDPADSCGSKIKNIVV